MVKLKLFQCGEDPFNTYYCTAFSRQRAIQMANEWDDEAAKRIVEGMGGPLLVTGKYPGTGKSSLAMRWARQVDKKMLVVCPSNALADKISKDDGFDAITLHTIVGWWPEGTKDSATFKPTDVGPYEVILFKEVYFYTVQQLEWLATFMAAKKRAHMIIANGDPAQNEPVMQELSMEFDAYYDKIMAWIFPRRLNLEIAKRYTADDHCVMEVMYDQLRNDALSSERYSRSATTVGCGRCLGPKFNKTKSSPYAPRSHLRTPQSRGSTLGRIRHAGCRKTGR